MAGSPLSGELGRLADNCINRAQRDVSLGWWFIPEIGKTVTHVVNNELSMYVYLNANTFLYFSKVESGNNEKAKLASNFKTNSKSRKAKKKLQ